MLIPNGAAYLSSFVANSQGPYAAHRNRCEHSSPPCSAAAATELDQELGVRKWSLLPRIFQASVHQCRISVFV